MIRKLLLSFLFLLLPLFGFGQVDLVQWNGSTDLVPTILNDNIVASSVTGNGITGPAPGYDGITGTGWPTGNIDLNKYFQITLNPILDGALILNEINFTYKGNFNSFQVRYSKASDFSNPITITTVTNAASNNTPTAVSLTNPISINAGEKIYIRFYAYNGSGEWKLMNNNLLKLRGTLTAPSKMIGPYLIGSASGASFPTISAAVKALTSIGARGDVKFLLDNPVYDTSTNETFPIVIKPYVGNDLYKVTFKPNTTKTVTVTASNNSNNIEAVFKLNGVDNVIFDGSNTENGTTKDLTLYNSTTSTNSNNKRTVIWIASENNTNGSNNNEIRNIILNQHNKGGGDYSIGIFAGGTSSVTSVADAANSYTTVKNVEFNKVGQAIYVNGNTSTSLLSSNWYIRNNTIGNTTTDNTLKPYVAVNFSNVKDYEVSDNTINGLINDINQSVSSTHAAIWVSGKSNGSIFNNKIANLSNSLGNGTPQSRGIYIDSDNNLIYNNFISNIYSSVTSGGNGIYINSGSGNKIYYNTIVMNNNNNPSGSSCLYINGGSAFDIKNNIFYNSQTNGKQYAVYSKVANTAFTPINYNDYYAPIVGFLNADKIAIADWIAATSQDAQSQNIIPTFLSSLDFHLASNNTNNELLKGISLSGITTDIDGGNRTKPYIGADEIACTTSTMSLSSAAGTNVQTTCINSPITNITYATSGATQVTATGLPAGVTGSFASNIFTISGSPTTTTGSPFNYTVTLTGCGTVTATGTITVTPNNTITLSSAAGTNAQTACINTAITPITYNTTGATGATVSGLPAGISGSWTANVLTISGIPTTSSTTPFNYTVTLIGGCGNITTTGAITVNPTNTITLSSAALTNAQTTCINTAITSITYNTTGATGATVSGLPTGVSGSWNANVLTISGTPTVSSATPFSYTVNLIGGCETNTAAGTITVNPNIPASVTIIPDHTEKFCQGTGVRFNTITKNGGSAPQYQWYKGNTPIPNQTGNTILFFDLVDGDKVKVVMTSSNAGPCLTGSPATSNEIQVSVYMTDRGFTTGGKHICLGSPSPLLKLVNANNPNNGAPYSYPEKIIRWEYSIDNNATWVPIDHTNGIIEYQPPILSVTTKYRAVAQGKKDDNSPCPITDAAVETPIYVDPAPTVTFTSQTGTTSCIGTDITYTTQENFKNYLWTVTGTLGTDYSISSGHLTNTSHTVTIKWLTAGTKTVTVNYTNEAPYNCYSATPASSTTFVNPTIIAPTILSQLQPTCATPTGSITLSGLPATGILRSLLGNSTTATFTITGTTTTISGLVPGKYKFAIDNPCGAPLYSAEVNLLGNIWDGAKWSKTNNSTLPTPDDLIIFEGDYTAVNDIKACSCTINSGNVIISGGKTLNITNEVTVNGGTLTFNDAASLLQTNPTALNSGAINYKRKSVDIRLADYVYWSSPVENFKVGLVSPLTSAKYLYSNNGTNWVNEAKANRMVEGKGYIIRGPDNITNDRRYSFEATFTGKPNNGNISGESVKKDLFYLVGNPYPSALDADEFLDRNRAILEGTLYFWTHNTPVVLGGAYEYSSDDYATYNLSGGSGTGPGKAAPSGDDDDTGDNKNNENVPSGFIGAGQSFFTGIAANGQIKFDNDMRAGANTNGQFFKPGNTAKTSALEKHRVWLNMTNAKGAFKQILVGYIQGASNGYERFYDGTTLDGNLYVDFYSVNDGNNLVIQGRALPFADTDTVPLGYKSKLVGDFTIAIDHADGKMNTQAIYLEDKATGKIHDLTTANYTFTTEKGTFNDRFVLRYTNKTLGTGDFENIENGLLVSVKDKLIKVTSAKEPIKEVTVFDIAGRLLYNKKKVGSNELEISNLQSANQVLLVKVILENDYVATKKIIFN